MQIHNVSRLGGLFAFTLVAALAPARAATAQGRGTPDFDAPYIERPLAVPARHVQIQAGLGFGDNSWNYGENGAGFNADGTVGIVDGLEAGLGFGIRFGDGARAARAERYVRVNENWLPADTINGTNDALGGDVFTNPYAHIRWAFLNRAPVMIGIEGLFSIPFVYQSCWSVGFGVPIHLIGGRRIRFETGFYNEFLFGGGCATTHALLYVPLRLNFQVTDRLWLGFRGDIQAYDYRFDNGNWAMQLGFQGGVRVIPQLDIQFQWVFPEFIHYDPAHNENTFFNVFGFGVAALIRIP